MLLKLPNESLLQSIFLKLKCTDNTKSTIASALKSERNEKLSSLKKISRTRKENASS